MATKHIPGTKPIGLVAKKWLVELISSVPPIIVAAIAAYRLFDDPSYKNLGYWAAAGCVWLLGSSILKILHAASQDKDTDAKRDHDGLKAALLVLQAAAGRVCGIDPNKQDEALRLTFHRVLPPLESPKEIEQIVSYVGGTGGTGRIFSVRSGITGRCVRTKQPMAMHRQQDDLGAYQKELVGDWGFMPVDASKITPDRYSLMSVPVLDASSKHVLGVIYIDAKQKDLFVGDDVISTIIESCAGVTRYVSERY